MGRIVMRYQLVDTLFAAADEPLLQNSLNFIDRIIGFAADKTLAAIEKNEFR